MASQPLWSIIEFLRVNQTVTPRQVQALLGCDSKKSHNLLLHLIRKSVVLRTGASRHPVYRLHPCGQVNIKPVKPAEVNTVARLCRQNWQGYQVHKIFGSAQK